MARFRDMRRFARFVKEQHVLRLEEKTVRGNASLYGLDYEWPPADVTQEKFAKRENISGTQVLDICDDCIAFDYLRRSELKIGSEDHTLIVTSKGRHLLMRLGLFREVAKDNSEWINLVVAFLIGLLTAAVTLAGPVWIFLHTKPSAPSTVNNYIQNKTVAVPCTYDAKLVTDKVSLCPLQAVK